MVGPRVTRAPHDARDAPARSLAPRRRPRPLLRRPPGARERCRAVRRATRHAARRTVRFRGRAPGRRTSSPPRRRYQRAAPRAAAREPAERAPAHPRHRRLDDPDRRLVHPRAAPGRRALVRSDARVSTGISKPSLLDWRAHAREQAAGVRPDVTVMFLGANDGFPMAGADCCGRPGSPSTPAAPATMMRSLRARRPRPRVLAAAAGAARRLLPRDLPGGERRAAPGGRGLEDDVRLIELDDVFTPGGRYRRLDAGRRQASCGCASATACT